MSIVSPILTMILSGLAYWIWRKVKGLLTENRDLAKRMDMKLDAMANNQHMHEEADLALFNSLGNRLSKAEGSIEILVQVLASREGGVKVHSD